VDPYETAVEIKSDRDLKLGIARVRDEAAQKLRYLLARSLNYPPNPDREAAARTLTRRIAEEIESTEQWTNNMSANQNNPGGAEAQKNGSGTRKARNQKPATQSRRDRVPGFDCVERLRIKYGDLGVQS
jgi:hypothetical protein